MEVHFDDAFTRATQARSELVKNLRSEASEHDWRTLQPSAGRVPPSLNGTLYFNGAGRRHKDHWIEGDGFVTAARFQDGRVQHAGRFVRTPSYARAKRSMLPRSEANTAVLAHGHKLFALWEAAPPWELDPKTLETREEHTFAGQLDARSWFGADGFSAHPVRDPRSGEVWTYGVRYFPKPTLSVYRLRDRLILVRRVRLPARYLVHACALTESAVVFSLGPAIVNPLRRSKTGIVGAVDWHAHEPTRIVLVPRNGERERVLETEPFYQWHFAGAFDHGGDVLFDVVRFRSWFAMQHAVASFSGSLEPHVQTYATLWRYRVQPNGRVQGYPISAVPLEFPSVDPRRATGGYRHIYGAAVRAPESGMQFTSVAKYDAQSGALDEFDYGAGHCVSEPLFVARAEADDDGWLLAYHRALRDDQHELAIFDARRVSAGPICTLPVPNVGSRFHGQWSQEVVS